MSVILIVACVGLGVLCLYLHADARQQARHWTERQRFFERLLAERGWEDDADDR